MVGAESVKDYPPSPVDLYLGLPWWLSNKDSICNAGDTGDADLIPGSGSSPGEGHGSSLQYFYMRNPTDREAWWATAHGVTNSWLQLSK